MPHYDFECDCGEVVLDVYQGMSDAHTQVCPGCGEMMRQIYHSPIITGDLPTIGCWTGYYDPQLGEHITSAQQRKDLMKKKGLEDFNMGDEQARMHKEVEYIREHAPKNEASGAINMLAAETKTKQDERYIAAVTDPVIDKVVGALPD